MAVIDGNPPPSNWQFRPIKLRAYEALHTLNRCFEATILSFKHLEELGVFRPEYLSGFKVTVERTRSLANDEVMQTLQEFEQEESAHFEDLQRAWDDQNADPDDVFFHARDRRQQIKEQIRHLQKGLERERPKTKTTKPRRARKPRRAKSSS